MTRKLVMFFSLVALIIALIFLVPWNSDDEKPPTLLDRLPNADLIGTANVLELSALFSKTLYHYQSPAKEFLAPGFLLSQGKNYGLDLQSPVYFFMNENNESTEIKDWGGMVHVVDSSKIGEGVALLSNLLDLEDLVIQNTRVFRHKPLQMFVAYGADWLLFYTGTKFNEKLAGVLAAKENEISPEWRSLINDAKLSKENILARVTSKQLVQRGVKNARIALSNDSSSITLHTVLNPFDSVSFSIKSNGYHLIDQEFTKSLVNVQINIDKLKRNKRDPLYAVLTEIGSKISFPTDDFLDTWTGDLALRQGGLHTIKKEYIESELDDDFNITEVVKIKEEKIAGMSGYLSLNDNSSSFLNLLFKKGILTSEEDRVRALYSPPLQLNFSDTSLLLHTSNQSPKLISGQANFGHWTFDKTRVSFYLDSTSSTSIYGRVNLPLGQIMEMIFQKE